MSKILIIEDDDLWIDLLKDELPEKIENMVFTGGAALVIMLMFFAIFNDISRFF